VAIKKLNPYLNFNGTAEKAIKLYESALGAKTEKIMRFGDIPDFKVEPENKNLVMHAALFIGGGVIMVSDCQPGDSQHLTLTASSSNRQLPELLEGIRDWGEAAPRSPRARSRLRHHITR
jgi:uncharacterized glyoxalase superfamily protein PhnB